MTIKKSVVVLGTLDTKWEELLFAKEQIENLGYKSVLIDLSVGSKPSVDGDITAREVWEAGGGRPEDLWTSEDRPKLNKIITAGAIKKVRELYESGQLGGILAIGGAGGTLIETDIMKSIPFGVPKFMVSSNAAFPGMAERYFGTCDITMMHTVVDIAGLSDMLKLLIAQAVRAICGMVDAPPMEKLVNEEELGKPSVALCELMMSAESVRALRDLLRKNGYRVTNFMATGIGDAAMETMIEEGRFDAVVDLALPGIIDSVIVGGTRKAPPNRLEAAGRMGIPQVIAPGAMDHIAPRKSAVTPELASRKSYVIDRERQLIRSSADELVRAAGIVAEKLNKSRGPVKFLIPLKGWSRIDGPGRPMYDPEAGYAFVQELRKKLIPEIEIREIDCWIEDERFRDAVVEALNEMMGRDK